MSSDDNIRENLTSGGLIIFDATSFYGVLRQTEHLDSLQQLQRDTGSWRQAMTRGFEEAYGINYENIFLHAIRILDVLPSGQDTESALQEIYNSAEYVTSRSGLLQQDLSGRIYHSALGKTLAKNFATYYTRIPSSDLLAWLAVEEWDDKVADFACGSGTLPNSAYSRKLSVALPDALEEDNGLDSLDDIHREFIEEHITGLDAMGYAAHLSIVNLAMQRPQGQFRSSGIYQVPVSDPDNRESRLGSLDLLNPNSNSIEVQQRIDGGSIGASGQNMEVSAELQEVTIESDYDVVIMNPPFTRKDRATEILNMSKVNEYAREHNEDMTGQTGLAAPFVLLGDRYLNEGGRLALVLPTAVVNRYSWDAVRKMLAENYHVEHMLVSWAPSQPAWSEDTDLREVLLVARKLEASESNGGDTIVTHVDADINFTQAREIAESLGRTDTSNISIRQRNALNLFSGMNQLGASKSFPAAFLKNHTDNWYRFAAYREPDLVRLMLSLEGILSPREAPYGLDMDDITSQFSEFANVQLFLKNIGPAGYRVVEDEPDGEASWTVNTSTINKIHLEEEDVEWVYEDPSLDVTEPFNYNTGSLLVTEGGDFYHSMKITATAPEQPATGSVWFPVDIPELETTDGETVTPHEAGKVVAAWLNSSIGFVPLFGYRAEVRGARGKYKTRQLRRVTVLDPSKLTREQVDGMIEAYDDVRDIEWNLIRYQLDEALDDDDHPRRRLDEKVCEAIVGEDHDVDIDQLESDLLEDINRLGQVMDG